ncbi:hypothetical protein GYB29_08125 [bacterium]|nr:hypothetical protein [bacterium]
MEFHTTLIEVSGITTRNEPREDPETILNQVQHMVQDDPKIENTSVSKDQRLFLLYIRFSDLRNVKSQR